MHIHIYIVGPRVEFFFENLSYNLNEFFSYMITKFIENLIVNSINFYRLIFSLIFFSAL